MAARSRSFHRPPVNVIFQILSASELLFVIVCYAWRPNWAAAVTYYPPWVWVPIGLLLLLLSGVRPLSLPQKILLLFWALFPAIFMGEPRSLLRFGGWPTPQWTAARSKGTAFRVVTLNCAGIDESALEVEKYHPDLLLLQEVPGKETVLRLAERLYGNKASVHCGVDQAILAGGNVTPEEVPKEFRTRFVRSKVTLKNGLTLEVVSLHLTTPQVRVDLWSPECWRDQAQTHAEQLRQVRAILRATGASPDAARVIGGDFNAPAGDGVFRLLGPHYHDAFSEGGRGWGDTIVNDRPLLRIDQVWASDRLRGALVIAVRTRNSDHRMVVADLILDEHSGG